MSSSKVNDPAEAKAPQDEKRGPRRWLGPLKLALGIGLLAALLIWNDNGRKLIEVLGEFRPQYILTLFAVALTTNAISSVKWGLFLSDRGYHLPWWRLFGLYLIGRFVSNFLPSMFGGDVARAYILGRDIKSQSISAASVVLERASGLVGLALLALLGCVINPSILDNALIAIPLALAVIGTAVGVAAFFVPQATTAAIRIAENIPVLRRVAHKVAKLLNDIGHYRNNYHLLLLSLAYSFLFHMVAAVNVYVSCLAIGLEVRFLDIMVITPIILLLSMIPVSPNNLGWWEWCFSVLLMSAGATAAQGLAVAVLIRAVTFVLSLVGGLLLLTRQFRPTPSEG